MNSKAVGCAKSNTMFIVVFVSNRKNIFNEYIGVGILILLKIHFIKYINRNIPISYLSLKIGEIYFTTEKYFFVE